mmetsp:Transcript_2094/g.4795  ORF Transcript_2094/g.4795 Transcript_2094/m.4795 type:complete len:139 (+) Transcript_2094:650-1066(+)
MSPEPSVGIVSNQRPPVSGHVSFEVFHFILIKRLFRALARVSVSSGFAKTRWPKAVQGKVIVCLAVLGRPLDSQHEKVKGPITFVVAIRNNSLHGSTQKDQHKHKTLKHRRDRSHLVRLCVKSALLVAPTALADLVAL